MNKYRVSISTKSDPNFAERYSYDNFREMKEFVKNYLEKELQNPTGKTPNWAGVMYIMIVLQFLAVARLAARRKSFMLAALAGVLLSGCWGVGHTQVHRGRKTSRWNLLRYAMDLTGFSSYETTVTHAMSHHQNPNTNHDIEVYHLQDIGLYFLSNEPKASFPIYRLGIFALSSSIIAPSLYVFRVVQRALEGNLLKEDIIIPTALLAMMCRESKSIKSGLKLGFFMWAAFSSWFVPMSFCVHHSMDNNTGAPLCYHEGEPEDMQRDFAAHQIVSTLDFASTVNDYVACTLFAHLNIHTVHHIFPTIDRVFHKPLLEALIKENTGKFRDFYMLRNKVNKNFLTELLPSVYKYIMSRRFEIVK
jgi:fatty acid desaturase